MTRYPKEKIGSLSELSRSDPRIRTPPDRKPGDVSHDVVQGRRLIIGIDRVLDQRYPRASATTLGVMVYSTPRIQLFTKVLES